MKDKLSRVGTYRELFNQLTGCVLPLYDIYQSSGLPIHVKKGHPDCLKYINSIPDIISSPDYIGTNPKEPDSVELIKILDKNILVAIKLDIKNQYFYVASLYDIPEAKKSRRIHSGRWIACK